MRMRFPALATGSAGAHVNEAQNRSILGFSVAVDYKLLAHIFQTSVRALDKLKQLASEIVVWALS